MKADALKVGTDHVTTTTTVIFKVTHRACKDYDDELVVNINIV